MKRYIKTTAILFMVLVCALISTFSCFATDMSDLLGVIEKNSGGIISVSHGGDTMSFPKNSFEAIRSAEKKGADMVSINISKTKDGVMVALEKGDLSRLCSTDKTDVSELTFKELEKLFMKNSDGTVSDCHVASLEKIVRRFMPKSVLVIDGAWELRDELSDYCSGVGAQSRVYLRTTASSKEIASWKKSGGKLPVIGVYSGNIVFGVISHLSRLSKLGEPMVQYQSKNYFCVAFDRFSAKRYSSGENARAVCAMYSKDLCGQREDNISGWDEMIKRGFSVIETNDIEGLESYIESIKAERETLASAVSKASSTDVSLCSSVSAKNLGNALGGAKAVLSNGNSSLGEIQSAISGLAQSMNELSPASGTETQKGALNITAGKVISVIVFGALLAGAEVYLVKMRKKKDSK